jgi:hypothetical protein
MKKKLVLIAIGFVSLIHTQAQNYSRDMGKITQYEADMVSYDKDPEAEAVVLYEIGMTYLQGNDITNSFELQMNKRVKIKILKQSGLDYGTVEIPYYESNDDMEKIQIKSAITYNFDNGILVKTPLDEKNIYEEKINSNWRKKKFAMPNVKEGSIIELEYLIISPFLFNLREWKFQHKIPVVYSNMELRVIPYYEYAYIAKRIAKFDEYSTNVINTEKRWGRLVYKEMLYKMGMREIPAFKDEEFISSEKDYMMSLNFQLSRFHNPNGGQRDIMSTWPALCNDFLKDENFGKYIKAVENEAKKLLPSLFLDGKTQKEKIKLIADYVRFNYNWNGNSDKFAWKKVSNTIKEKTGNAAELNLLLLGLLNKAGIEAKPVLLSTREHGVVDVSYPFQQFLNYVIVQVKADEDSLFLDATESLLPYNELPERCLNVSGLLVEKNSDQWLDIKQDNLALTEKHFDIKYNEDASLLEAKVTYTASAYDAYQYRRLYYGDEQNLKDFFARQEVNIKGDMDILSYNIPEMPFIFSFETQAPLDNVAGKLFISPFLNHAPHDNLFKQKTRSLPIDMIYRHAGTYVSKIEIPEGYRVDLLPKEVDYNGKTMLIQYSAEQNGNSIEVTAKYEFKESFFDAKNYMILNSTYNELIRIFNEMIFLSKI